MLTTIMVTAASGIIGYGIIRNLAKTGYRVIGTTIYETSPADCFADCVEIVPRADDEKYIEAILRIIREQKVDILIPGHEAELFVLNRHRQVIKGTGVVLLLNNSELIDLCKDKWLFFCELEKRKVKCRIKTSISREDIMKMDVPIVVKPRRGSGSKGFKVIKSIDELYELIIKLDEGYIFQQYVGSEDEEYSVSAFFDNSSYCKAKMAIKRRLSKDGYTEIAESVHAELFDNDIVELAEILKPIGPTNFQFRRVGDSNKLLEINPRISSSTSIRAKFGYNECAMAVDYFLYGKEIVQPCIKKGKAIRYIEDYLMYDGNNI